MKTNRREFFKVLAVGAVGASVVRPGRGLSAPRIPTTENVGVMENVKYIECVCSAADQLQTFCADGNFGCEVVEE